MKNKMDTKKETDALDQPTPIDLDRLGAVNGGKAPNGEPDSDRPWYHDPRLKKV